MSIVTVPNIVGLSLTDAQTALTAVGLTLGTETPALNPNVAVGDVAFQFPAAYAVVNSSTIIQSQVYDSNGNPVFDSYGDPVYTEAAVPTAVDIGMSAIAVTPNLDLTVISQYAQSPVLMQMIVDFSQWFDQSANWNNFYQYVWNIDTAQGFGLDFWGSILGVSRYLLLPITADYLGLTGSDGTSSGYPFDVGVFFDGATDTQTYALPDPDYRTLLYAKAFANICRTCIPVMNQLLRLIFSQYGDAYVLDDGGMQMTYYFGWALTPIQSAIVNASGVLPIPTGVAVVVSSAIIATEGGVPITDENSVSLAPG
ncbi:MAG: DUF2612 domain-containing protein [Gammaproteobacteria bacterium]|nr:DUF2612 domain-containing protein [Gammaproteobacteria bacterium]